MWKGGGGVVRVPEAASSVFITHVQRERLCCCQKDPQSYYHQINREVRPAVQRKRKRTDQ